jgi:hypothetical protein
VHLKFKIQEYYQDVIGMGGNEYMTDSPVGFYCQLQVCGSMWQAGPPRCRDRAPAPRGQRARDGRDLHWVVHPVDEQQHVNALSVVG